MREKVQKGAGGDAGVEGAATVRARVQQSIAQLKGAFIERDDAIDCVWTALVAGTNFLLVGDPGTAKTMLAKAAFSHVSDARVFTTLCGSFATEDKIFGPVDLRAYKEENVYRRATDGRLAGCDLAFLDELFKSNEGCLNGMLTALNERTYEGERIPLVCCGSATNWPEVLGRSKTTHAIWDRLVLRCPVGRVAKPEGASKVDEKRIEAARNELLRASDRLKAYVPSATVSLEELSEARAEASRLELDDRTRGTLVSLAVRLEREKIAVSDRRLAQMQDVLRAASWIHGADKVGLDAFDALRFGLWDNRDEWLSVKAVIDTVDEAVVQEAVRKLQQAHRQAAGCQSPGQAPHALKQAADASEEVKELIKRSGVRRSSMENRIRPEVRKLQAEYERLKGQVGAGIGARPATKADAGEAR